MKQAFLIMWFSGVWHVMVGDLPYIIRGEGKFQVLLGIHILS